MQPVDTTIFFFSAEHYSSCFDNNLEESASFLPAERYGEGEGKVPIAEEPRTSPRPFDSAGQGHATVAFQSSV
jgi:hypothetical protein